MLEGEEFKEVLFRSLNKIQLAFVGRSNVGKSTVINSILGAKLAEASKTPGKTQNLFFFKVSRLNAMLVDCPGYGFASATDLQRE